MDGLSVECEQRITIDVAYRSFATDRRKLIVADTPGHKQYTRNMVTSASNADVAIVLIDARQGILTQTRRHSMIYSVLGSKNVILAINKMDLVKYSQEHFHAIKFDYRAFADALNFEQITTIPISALQGVNVIERSTSTSWCHGPTLMGFSEAIDVQTYKVDYLLRFPVQWVITHPHLNFQGFSETLEAGQAKVGQSVRILPSGETAIIKDIILFKDHLNEAQSQTISNGYVR